MNTTKMSSMKSKSAGFTMVELIIVIAILGVLAATALPKFVNVGKEARVAAVNGIAGALRSSVSTAQGAYFAANKMTATEIKTADGTTVTVAAGTGIPTADADGILKALSTDGLTVDSSATPITFQPSGGSATCQATYAAGTVVAITSGC
jgi:MSHA pilin protein MshA